MKSPSLLNTSVVSSVSMDDKYVQFPQGNVLLRNLSKKLPLIERAEGPYLYDKSGKKYFDAAGGAMVMACGHGNREIVQAITDQLSRVAYVNGTQFSSAAMETLGERLATKAKSIGLSRTMLLSSGSEAVEAAIKFARQLWVERGKPEKQKLIARMPGYHGNTLYALSASGRPHYKKVFGPLLLPVVTVSCPYGYRCPVDYEKEGAVHYLKELEETILREKPETISAFILETISGSSTGAWAPPPGYLEGVEALCKKHGILIIADEVMCGAGRTGKFFAAEHYKFHPDILVLGKGLSSGYIAVSALMVREDDVKLMHKGSGYFIHMQTYVSAPMLAAAALASVNFMDKHHLIENSAKQGEYLQQKLRKEILPLPFVGSVSGKGLFAGVEFVENKTTKAPFKRIDKKAEKLVEASLEEGLTVWPNVGHANGVDGDLLMFGPPLQLTVAQVDEMVDLLKRAIAKAFH